MMRTIPRLPVAAALAATLATAGCVAPVGPVSVTRFHLEQAPQSRGLIEIQPAEGMDAQSLAYRDYAAALARELAKQGYTPTGEGQTGARQVALLSIDREILAPAPGHKPVSVGVGGNAGSYGAGFGVGLGIDFSGPPKAQAVTHMQVRIRDIASEQTLWEGRAAFTVRADSPLATTSLGAAKMAEALFKGFPGKSGETISVR